MMIAVDDWDHVRCFYSRLLAATLFLPLKKNYRTAHKHCILNILRFDFMQNM